jgi:hypothetical protein
LVVVNNIYDEVQLQQTVLEISLNEANTTEESKPCDVHNIKISEQGLDWRPQRQPGASAKSFLSPSSPLANIKTSL